MHQINLRTIIAQHQRLVLFDIAALLINIVLISFFTGIISSFAEQAGNRSKDAKVIMALFCLAILFLLPLGAIFKRW
jgi:hypothetical protein